MSLTIMQIEFRTIIMMISIMTINAEPKNLETNLAHRNLCIMSSILYYYPCDSGLDGNLHTSAATNNEKNPWFVIQLDGIYKNLRIRIYNTLRVSDGWQLFKAWRNAHIYVRDDYLGDWTVNTVNNAEWKLCDKWDGPPRPKMQDPDQIYEFKCNLYARYVKVQFINENDIGNMPLHNMEVREIEVYGKKKEKNLAQNKVCLSSSVLSWQYETMKAFDGNLGTYAATRYETNPWIVVKLHGLFQLTHVKILNSLYGSYIGWRNTHIWVTEEVIHGELSGDSLNKANWKLCANWYGGPRPKAQDPDQIYDFECKINARYVKVQHMNEKDLPNVQYPNLEFRELEVYGKSIETNVAFLRSCLMSSLWSNSYQCGNAIDGYITSTSASTDYQANPWIIVNLGDVYEVTHVRVFNSLWYAYGNRYFYLTWYNTHVWYSEEIPPAGMTWESQAKVDWKLCAKWDGGPRRNMKDPEQIYNFDCGKVRARYVKVQHMNEQNIVNMRLYNMDIREIEVYGTLIEEF